jgi:hypothetical protein
MKYKIGEILYDKDGFRYRIVALLYTYVKVYSYNMDMIMDVSYVAVGKLITVSQHRNRVIEGLVSGS